MEIQLLRSAEVNESLLQDVVPILDFEPPFEVNTIPTPIPLDDVAESMGDRFLRMKTLRSDRRIADDCFLILLTSKPNTENWFSSFDSSERRNVFIQTNDWEHYVDCENKYAVAYGVLANCLQCLMFKSSEDFDWAHDPPIGCVNDMCSWKPDITLKMRTADICPDCLAKCEENDVVRKFLDQALPLMGKVREQTLFTASLQRKSPNRDLFPFPVAITARKLRQTREPLRRFLSLIDHFDSLIRTTTLMAARIYLPDSFDDFAVRNKLSLRPSLGIWLRGLQDLGRHQGLDGVTSADFQESFELIFRKAEEDKLVHIRNEKRAHGYIDVHDDSYKNNFDDYQQAISNITSILSKFFNAFWLIYVKQDDFISHGEACASGWRLMGDHPDFVQEEIRYNPKEWGSRPFVNHVYAVPQHGGAWFDLHNSIIYGKCPECEHNRVLMADGEQYLDPYGGHRVRLPQ